MSLDNPQAAEVVRITKLVKGYVINAIGGYTVACRTVEELTEELAEIAVTLETVQMGTPPVPEPLPHERGVDYSTPPAEPGELVRDPEIQRVNLWQAARALTEGLISSEDWDRARSGYFPDVPDEEVSQALDALEQELGQKQEPATPATPVEQKLVSDDVIAGLRRLPDVPPAAPPTRNAPRRTRRTSPKVGRNNGAGNA